MLNLFSKKTKTRGSITVPVDSHTAIQHLRENIGRQEKREAHLQSKIEKLALEAKTKLANGDKRGAVFCMKKKKLHDAELAKIEQVKMTLETQAIHLESASANVETYNTMKSGTSAMTKIRKAFGIDDVDKLIDETRDEMELHQEVEHAFAQPIDPYMVDDDELLAELNALEAEDTRQAASLWPMTPTKNPVKASSNANVAAAAKPAKSSRFALFA